MSEAITGSTMTVLAGNAKSKKSIGSDTVTGTEDEAGLGIAHAAKLVREKLIATHSVVRKASRLVFSRLSILVWAVITTTGRQSLTQLVASKSSFFGLASKKRRRSV